jgi:hypothetical protein
MNVLCGPMANPDNPDQAQLADEAGRGTDCGHVAGPAAHPARSVTPPGSVHLYARWRARERVGPVRASLVERQHPPDRQADRGHAQAAEVRERFLRPPVPGGGCTAYAGRTEWRGQFRGARNRPASGPVADPRERHLAEQQQFLWLTGREHTPGVPAETAQVAIQSDTTVCWDATLQPFAVELPPAAHWVDFVRTPAPNGEAGRIADRWRRADQRNRSLCDLAIYAADLAGGLGPNAYNQDRFVYVPDHGAELHREPVTTGRCGTRGGASGGSGRAGRA